jgi:hypothetical protein
MYIELNKMFSYECLYACDSWLLPSLKRLFAGGGLFVFYPFLFFYLFYLFFSLFIYLHVCTLFGSFLPPAPIPFFLIKLVF